MLGSFPFSSNRLNLKPQVPSTKWCSVRWDLIFLHPKELSIHPLSKLLSLPKRKNASITILYNYIIMCAIIIIYHNHHKYLQKSWSFHVLFLQKYPWNNPASTFPSQTLVVLATLKAGAKLPTRFQHVDLRTTPRWGSPRLDRLDKLW